MDNDVRASCSPELMALVERDYPLTGPRAGRDLGGGYSLNLLIKAGEGDFVVRVYGPWVSPERLAAVQHVRERLRAREWPIAPMLRNRTADGFSVLGNRLVEVERYVASESGMNTWPALQTGARTLARLHDELRRIDAPTPAHLAPMANHIPAARISDETAPAIATIRQWDLTAAERHYLDSAEQLAAELHRIHEKTGFEPPQQLVHGDFWDNNVHFTGDQIVRIGDFDFLGARPRVDDLALTLFFTNEHSGRDDTSSERLKALRRLVDAYDSALQQPLSPDERAALPYAIARSPLTFLRDIAYNGPENRAELTELRGPEYDWALCMLASPNWQAAFR